MKSYLDEQAIIKIVIVMNQKIMNNKTQKNSKATDEKYLLSRFAEQKQQLSTGALRSMSGRHGGR